MPNMASLAPTKNEPTSLSTSSTEAPSPSANRMAGATISTPQKTVNQRETTRLRSGVECLFTNFS